MNKRLANPVKREQKVSAVTITVAAYENPLS